MMHKDIMSQATLEKMKILNDKLQHLQIQIFIIASEYDRIFKQKVDDQNDSLKQYEINVKVYFERDKDTKWDREAIVLEQWNLEGITYEQTTIDRTEWILHAQDHCDGAMRASHIKGIKASYLFHQLYYHNVRLEEENTCRILKLDEIVSFPIVDFEIELTCSYWDGKESNIYD